MPSWWPTPARRGLAGSIAVGVGLGLALVVGAGSAHAQQGAPGSGAPASGAASPQDAASDPPGSGPPGSGAPGSGSPPATVAPPTTTTTTTTTVAPAPAPAVEATPVPVPADVDPRGWPGAETERAGVEWAAATATGLVSPSLMTLGAAPSDGELDALATAARTVEAANRTSRRELEAVDRWAGHTLQQQRLSRSVEIGRVDEHYLRLRSEAQRTQTVRVRALRGAMQLRNALDSLSGVPKQLRPSHVDGLARQVAVTEASTPALDASVAAAHARARAAVVEAQDGEALATGELVAARRGDVQTRTAGLRQRALDSLRAAQRQLVEARLREPVPGTGFDLVLLDAFHRAAATEDECGLRWSVIAAISRIESWHGTYGGGAVGIDGRTSGRIVGPPLNGRGPVALIRDSENGLLDGDPVYDRAVGPMQFIPTSWNIYGADGDGDGVSDPHDYHDAALAAAIHLCRSAGGHVSTEELLAKAVRGYNRSESYRQDVRHWTTIYDHALIFDSAHLG